MQLSLEPTNATCRVTPILSDRKVNEISVMQGYLNPKIITFAIEMGMRK